MRKQLFLIGMLCAMGTAAFGQKAKFSEVNLKSYLYPSNPLPDHFKTYQLVIDDNRAALGRFGITPEEARREITFDLFQLQEAAGDLVVKLWLDLPTAGEPHLATREYKTGTPPNEKTTTFYVYEAGYSIPIGYEVTDKQGKLMDKQDLSVTTAYVTPEATTAAAAKEHYDRNGKREIQAKMLETLREKLDLAGYRLRAKYDYQSVAQVYNVAHLKSDKNAVYDHAGYEKAFDDLQRIGAEKVLKTGSEAVKADLQPVLDFWSAQLEKLNPENKQDRHLVAVCSYNLALVYGLLDDYKQHDHYVTLLDRADVKDAWAGIMKKVILDRRTALEQHNQFKQDLHDGKVSIYCSAQDARGPANIFELNKQLTTQQELNNRAVMKGYLVTIKGDTLWGEFVEFDANIARNRVEFAPAGAKKEVYKPELLAAFSADGGCYQSIAKQFVQVLYDSPSVQLVRIPKSLLYLYFFKKENYSLEYKAFDKADAAAYVINYKKKLAEVFKYCPAVEKKIQAGEYELKTDRTEESLLKTVQDYEASCGSKDFNKYLSELAPDKFSKMYR